MKNPLALLLACCASLVPATSLADAADDLSALVTTCDDARAKSDISAATIAAAEIVKITGSFFSADLERRAIACLNEFAGASWTFYPVRGRFVTGRFREADQALVKAKLQYKAEADELLRETADLLQSGTEENLIAREALRTAKTDLAISRTAIACSALFQRDEIAALTNPVCNEVFLANGLPDK